MFGNYYVYVIFDPRKIPCEPIYVGKGKNKRYLDHLKENKSSNYHLKNKIKKIRLENAEPIIIKFALNLSNDEACYIEQMYIAKFGRLDLKTGTLCNHTFGGEGTPGFKHNESTKKLFSAQRKNKKQTTAQYLANCSRTVSDETKIKISKSSKGHHYHTPEQIEIIKKYNCNKIISDETKKIWSLQRKNKKQSTEHILAVQNSIKKSRELAEKFANKTISDSELEEYRQILIKRAKKNKNNTNKS